MAPFPEEVDVFSGPHTRMKTLVEVYSEKLKEIDFSEPGSLKPYMDTLLSTFYEFKSHEQIENRFIMRRLRKKMKDLRLRDAAVCNCHKDNRLSEMIRLLRDGYSCSTAEDWVDYGHKLQQALVSFTEDFLPHMQEEEEVFQPLLVRFFRYEELCSLKQQVMLEHEKSQSPPPAPGLLQPASSEATDISCLPPELLEHVFSFLGPASLARCSAVCRAWRGLALQPRLWTTMQPGVWHSDRWEDPLELPPAPYQPLCAPPWTPEDWEPDPPETRVLKFLEESLLPRVGPAVRKLVLAGFQRVSPSLLHSLLAQCPNLTHLDLSFSALTDSVFQGLEGVSPPLRWLSLAGCVRLTDQGLALLASYLGMGPPTLLTLSLSGCLHVSDLGLRGMSHQLGKVEGLDLSGCWKLTGPELTGLAEGCPRLQPGELAYCDFIPDGPFPQSATGCQTSLCCCPCSCTNDLLF